MFSRCLILTFVFTTLAQAFQAHYEYLSYQRRSQHDAFSSLPLRLSTSSTEEVDFVLSVETASSVLLEWDQNTNPDSVPASAEDFDREGLRDRLPGAVQVLNDAARREREIDSVQGRVMLGICAGSIDEGLATLKSWVGTLELPRGLLHGMDQDGVPIQLDGPVYLKYNTGGALTFSNIRKSGLGFDAIWKPGDVLVEPYTDGNYRGVYFQVELADGNFRQYLLPLDTFEQ